MNRFCILFIFCGFHLIATTYAQTIAFPQQGMEQGDTYSGNWTSPGVDNASIKFIKDTIINSQTYSFFTQKHYVNFYSRNIGTKIYYEGANLDGSLAGNTILFYDFGLNVGDTMTVSPFAYWGGLAIVDSTYMVTLLNGQQRKYLRLHNIASPTVIYRWIDGLGDIDYGFLVYNDFEGGHTSFVCQKDSSGLVYVNPNFNYDCDSLIISGPITIIPCGAPHTDCPTSPCDGHTHLCVSDGTPPYTFFWNPGGQTTLNLTGLCPGQYTLIASDANATSATTTISISQQAVLNVTCSANPDTIQPGDSTQLNSTVTGGTPPYSYYWSPPHVLNNTTISNPMAGAVTTMCYYVYVTDANGCTDSCQTCVITSTGVNDYSLENNATIYPNPFNTATTIEILRFGQDNNTKFEMFDVYGRQVKNLEVTIPKFEIQRENLPSGIYFYTLSAEKKLIGTGKLVVK